MAVGRAAHLPMGRAVRAGPEEDSAGRAAALAAGVVVTLIQPSFSR